MLNSSRNGAKRAGEPVYFTGRPCSKGHFSPRRTDGGACMECEKPLNHALANLWPRSRAEALDLVKDKYFTGRPCKRGHVAPRYTSTHGCVDCLAERRPLKSPPPQAPHLTGEHPPSRGEALRHGVSLYFTGLPCRNGHTSPRYASSGGCVACAKSAAREQKMREPSRREAARRALKNSS